MDKNERAAERHTSRTEEFGDWVQNSWERLIDEYLEKNKSKVFDLLQVYSQDFNRFCECAYGSEQEAANDSSDHDYERMRDK